MEKYHSLYVTRIEARAGNILVYASRKHEFERKFPVLGKGEKFRSYVPFELLFAALGRLQISSKS